MESIAVITLNTGTGIDLGPVTLAWHGLLTGLGIAVAAWVAIRYARERKLSEDRLLGLIFVIVLTGMVGARLFYLLEQDPQALARPTDWLGTNGFSFYGAIIASIPSALLYLRNDVNGLSLLDAAASGFGLGMAIGRLGDVLIGEHLGNASTLPWAIRYSNPDALAPSEVLAYQPGALYESLLGLGIFLLVWPQRDRFAPPGTMIAAVVGAYAVGRFLLFFLRNDSDQLIAGLSNAQVSSLLVAALAAGAAWWLFRRGGRPPAPGPRPGEPQERR